MNDVTCIIELMIVLLVLKGESSEWSYLLLSVLGSLEQFQFFTANGSLKHIYEDPIH